MSIREKNEHLPENETPGKEKEEQKIISLYSWSKNTSLNNMKSLFVVTSGLQPQWDLSSTLHCICNCTVSFGPPAPQFPKTRVIITTPKAYCEYNLQINLSSFMLFVNFPATTCYRWFVYTHLFWVWQRMDTAVYTSCQVSLLCGPRNLCRLYCI